MRSLKLALGFMLIATAAAAQSYPSPTFSGVTLGTTPGLIFGANQTISNSPTGNPTVGLLLPTYSTFNLQGNTVKSGNREFLMSCGLTSTTGFSASNGNQDKVCGYFGTVGSGSTGDIWAINPLAGTASTAGAINVQVIEADLNLENQSYNTAPGQYSGPVAVGITISGNSASGKTATSAIQVSSAGAGYWNRGVTLDGDSISSTGCFICDYANSHSQAIYITGHPTYGIYQTQSAVQNYLGGSLSVNNGLGSSSSDATGALSQISIYNSSNANTTAKQTTFTLFNNDTIGTQKSVGKIKTYLNDANAVDGGLTFYGRKTDASDAIATMFDRKLNLTNSTGVYQINGDTGISRTGAGQLAFGNGTQGNTSGGLTAGSVTATSYLYSAGAVYGNGVQGVSCAAGTVSLATLVVSGGVITHC